MTKLHHEEIPTEQLKSKIIHEIEQYPTVLVIRLSDGLMLEVISEITTSLTPKGFVKAIPRLKVNAYKPKPNENHSLDNFDNPDPPED